jgi:hypothetical protein
MKRDIHHPSIIMGSSSIIITSTLTGTRVNKIKLKKGINLILEAAENDDKNAIIDLVNMGNYKYEKKINHSFMEEYYFKAKISLLRSKRKTISKEEMEKKQKKLYKEGIKFNRANSMYDYGILMSKVDEKKAEKYFNKAANWKNHLGAAQVRF